MANNRGHVAGPWPVKDLEHEQPIAAVWRPVFRSIVAAFIRHDYALQAGVPLVAPVDQATATQIENYIAGYGDATIAELPEDTWETSVAMWFGTHWEAMVDLWTEEDGRSDMVLSAVVREAGSTFSFEIYMVYVP